MGINSDQFGNAFLKNISEVAKTTKLPDKDALYLYGKDGLLFNLSENKTLLRLIGLVITERVLNELMVREEDEEIKQEIFQLFETIESLRAGFDTALDSLCIKEEETSDVYKTVVNIIKYHIL